MWKKKQIINLIMNIPIGLTLLFIFISTNVLADSGTIETYKPNQIVDLSLHLTNDTGNVIGANCSAQIRTSNQSITSDISMREIGQGWYNATYNTSVTGKYYCRQNCTQGSLFVANTCDFVIKGDSEMQIAIILVMALVISFLFVLSRYVKIEAFRYLLIAVSSMVVILTINIGLILAKESLPSGVQELVITTYTIVLYTMEFLLFIGIIFVIFYYVAKWLPERFRGSKFK